MSNVIREDWVECTLGEVFETVTGNTPSKNEIDNYGNEIPFIKPPQIENSIIINASEFLSRKGGQKARILPVNSVLITCIGNLGRIGINKTEVAFNQQINALKPNSNIESKFTFYQAQSVSFRNQLEKLSTSTTVALVNKSSFNSIKFSIPPTLIQKAIVKKIEELFSSLDSGIADLKKAQDQLVIYRQAVLKKAFEGELTKEWREKQTNLPTADKLICQIDEISELHKIPVKWKWVKSNELFSFVTSGSRGWAKYYSKSGAIFIRITNLNFNTLELDLRSEKIQFVNPPKNSEGIRTKIIKGDFLFSITGYLGMFAIAPDIENAYVNQHVSLCRPKEGFNKKYVGYWIISKSGGIHYLNKNQKRSCKGRFEFGRLKILSHPHLFSF